MENKKKTSPSGIYLGINKSLAQHEALLRIAFDIMSIALSSILILPRWNQILLQKDSQPYIHRLRYITILEVYVQFIMKLWWAKELQGDIDKKSRMSKQQYARRGAITMDNLWSRQLTFDYHRSTGVPFFHVALYVRNYYDRVIPEITSLDSIRMGMHP